MAKLALVTGGAGYFGTLLVERLRASGHQVRILDIHRPDDVAPGVEVITADIRDREAVRGACRDVCCRRNSASLLKR